MKLSLRRRHHNDAGDEYADSLSAWQISHNADRHDMTIDQARRYHEHARMVNAGIVAAGVDENHAEFARFLTKTGRVGELPTAGAVDIARRSAWAGQEGGG